MPVRGEQSRQIDSTSHIAPPGHAEPGAWRCGHSGQRGHFTDTWVTGVALGIGISRESASFRTYRVRHDFRRGRGRLGDGA